MLRTDYESYEVTCKCLFSFTLVRNKSFKLCAHEIEVWLQLLGIVYLIGIFKSTEENAQKIRN